MFMVMDDVGRLFWRLGRKLIVSSAEHDDDIHEAPAPSPRAAHEQTSPPSIISPAAE